VVIQVETLRDSSQMLFLERLTRQNQAERRIVIDDDAPVAIQDAPSRRQHGDGLDAVGLRALVVEFRTLDLQLPESRDQEEEYDYCSVLKDGDLARRNVRIVAKRRLFRWPLCFDLWVDRREDHGTEPRAGYSPTTSVEYCTEK